MVWRYGKVTINMLVMMGLVFGGGAGGVEVRQLLCGSSYSTCHRYLPTLSFQHMKGPIIARLVMNAAIRAPEPERECQAFLHCKDHPLG